MSAHKFKVLPGEAHWGMLRIGEAVPLPLLLQPPLSALVLQTSPPAHLRNVPQFSRRTIYSFSIAVVLSCSRVPAI